MWFLHKLLRELQFPFCVNMSFQRKNSQVLIWLSLRRQRLERFSAVEKLSRRPESVWESKLWKNNWVAVVSTRESFQQNLLNNPVGRKETFLQTILVDHVNQKISVPAFCVSFWGSLTESRNCWLCVVLAWRRSLSNYLIWWKLHSAWISNGSEVLCWFETVFFGIESQIIQTTLLRYMGEYGKKGAQRGVCFLSLKQEQTKTKKTSLELPM